MKVIWELRMIKRRFPVINKRGPRGPYKEKPFKPLGDHPLPDKLDAIRNKYKYGVPNTVVEAFADEILTGLEVKI